MIGGIAVTETCVVIVWLPEGHKAVPDRQNSVMC